MIVLIHDIYIYFTTSQPNIIARLYTFMPHPPPYILYMHIYIFIRR